MTTKGIAKNSVIRLFVDVGYGKMAALGVSYDEAEVLMSKNGDPFVPKILTVLDWSELGDGYYTLRWSAEDMNTLGDFSFRVSCPYAYEEYFSSFEVDSGPYGVPSEAPVCIVTGNLVDIGGDPSHQIVVFRPRYVPGTAGASLITSDIIRTSADAFGNFSVKLLRSSQVIVEIEKSGIKNLITVPDSPSANLIDLLPPIPA